MYSVSWRSQLCTPVGGENQSIVDMKLSPFCPWDPTIKSPLQWLWNSLAPHWFLSEPHSQGQKAPHSLTERFLYNQSGQKVVCALPTSCPPLWWAVLPRRHMHFFVLSSLPTIPTLDWREAARIPQNIFYTDVSCFHTLRWHDSLYQGPRLSRRGHWNTIRQVAGLRRAFRQKSFSICYSHHAKWLSPGTLPWMQSTVCHCHCHRRVPGPKAAGEVAVGLWAPTSTGTPSPPGFHCKHFHIALAQTTKQEGTYTRQKRHFSWVLGEKVCNQISNQKTSRFSGMICNNFRPHNAAVQRCHCIAYSCFFLLCLTHETCEELSPIGETQTHAESHL